jgi:NitT/TauT family transport system permease protein
MRKAHQVLMSLLVLLLIWQATAILVGKDIIIPTPASTFLLIGHFVASGKILTSIWQTTWKVIVALFLSMFIGVPVGFFLGRSTFLYRFFRPWIMVLQAVPVISFLTLVIFAWGIGWKGPIFITTLSLLPTSILTTISGVRNLDIHLLEMANFYQVPSQRIFRDIYLGSLLPFISAILDVNIGLVWKVTLVAEYLCGGDGLGEQILMARMNIDTPGTWALTLIAISLGIATEIFSKRILRRTHRDGTLPQSHGAFKVI